MYQAPSSVLSGKEGGVCEQKTSCLLQVAQQLREVDDASSDRFRGSATYPQIERERQVMGVSVSSLGQGAVGWRISKLELVAKVTGVRLASAYGQHPELHLCLKVGLTVLGYPDRVQH